MKNKILDNLNDLLDEIMNPSPENEYMPYEEQIKWREKVNKAIKELIK